MNVTLNRSALVWTAAAVGLVASVGVYLSQDVINWPLTFSAGSNFAQIVALIVGGAWALNRFGVTRASRSFLEMSVVAKVVSSGGDGLLVEVTVRLKNIGGSRIDARTGYRAGEFLFDDGWDQCEHAGTLKIRAVPQKPVPLVFDWYGLKPLATTLTLSAPHKAPSEIAPRSGTLEQINYLADFQDPVGGFTDVGFWMEPNETYELTVPLWLLPGDYALKAYFLGQDRSHAEEEYWSQTHYCRLAPPAPNPPLQPASGTATSSVETTADAARC